MSGQNKIWNNSNKQDSIVKSSTHQSNKVLSDNKQKEKKEVNFISQNNHAYAKNNSERRDVRFAGEQQGSRILNKNSSNMAGNHDFHKNRNVHHSRKNHDFPPLNEMITHQTLFVLDQNGEKIGLMNLKAALQLSREKGLDLLLIDQNQNPPVAKILNYEKYRFQKQKDERKEKSKQRKNNLEQKELYFRPITGDHDVNVKVKHAVEFLNKGHRVYIGVKLKGRENKNKEVAIQMANKIRAMLEPHSLLDKDIQVKDNEVYFILKPKKN